MLKIGLIREEKIPADNRVAFTPSQCKWIQNNFTEIKIIVQHSEHRCFSDKEYSMAGIEVSEDISDCDILMGIKEVPVEMLMSNKTYFIFSHTKKLQSRNRKLLQAIIKNKITLIDYECLEHDDGTRILGFGFFAGIVGAHNGMMAYGERTKIFHLDRVNSQKDFRHLIHTYFGLKLPSIKIAITGSGRVAHGVLEIMNLMGIHETEPDLFLDKIFSYPVYVHLKGADLYENKKTGKYDRREFHAHPEKYKNLFRNYISVTDILMNGVYWEKNIPRLFELKDLANKKFNIKTIADISDDRNGSVPCNIGDSTIEEPVYGVSKKTFKVIKPYIRGSVDVMAVGNLPNELPRDASRYFGEQIVKYILKDIINGSSEILNKATIVKKGKLTKPYSYMREYATLTS
ncbi:MAG TPA: NAD(P)-dependent oxidoreductase [Chitinophagaceae bacterium]